MNVSVPSANLSVRSFKVERATFNFTIEAAVATNGVCDLRKAQLCLALPMDCHAA